MRSSFFSYIVAFFLFFQLSTGWSIQQGNHSAGSINLPAQQQGTSRIHLNKQLSLSRSATWQTFTRKYGNWRVQWNERLGTIHRAYGQPIPLYKGTLENETVLLTAVGEFFKNNASLLNVDSKNLKLKSAQLINNKWYVHYTQTYEGIEVLFSEIELRVAKNGNLMAFGVDYFPITDLSTEANIPRDFARDMALSGLTATSGDISATVQDDLYILPVVQEEGEIKYHLVYRIDILVNDPPGNYATFVDAQTGELVWRFNRVRYAEGKGTMRGLVQLELPTDGFTSVPFEDAFVKIGGVPVRTDSIGFFSRQLTSTLNLVAELRGPWVDVDRDDGDDAIIVRNISPGDSIVLFWDNTNSHPAERDVFYHVNLIHNFITTLDPNFIRINYSMPARVNINQNCNAFWNGVGVNFFLSGGGCPNTGQMPSVIYHEYGHGINDKLYEQLGSSLGMINGATHEGMADVIAAFMEDDSRVGRGFFGFGSVLRDIKNFNKYPQDNIGQVHNDGLILAGAFWDLRELTSLDVALRLSHFAKYGLPDDLDNGIAFSEWYLETLIADDDDGNLDNGTPHFDAINQAFNKHGIGSSLFLQISFDHQVTTDFDAARESYPVTFSLSGVPLTGGAPDSIRVVYSTDNFATKSALVATQISENQYQASIPKQPAGTEVRYYIQAFDPISQSTVFFPLDAPQKTFRFLVGFEPFFEDDFETDKGWQVGAPDDDATTGIWERNVPQTTVVGTAVVQPGEDHSPQGERCYVTGALSGNSAGTDDVDDGKTTLFSPIFNLSGLENPVIRYYKWYTNAQGAEPNQDFWRVEISNDGGQKWVIVENTRETTFGWEMVQFFVEDFITPTSQVQMKFVASDMEPGSLVEALIDDFQILQKSATITGIDETSTQIPKQFALKQNYPNPFNPVTTIEIDVPNTAKVILNVYDILGRKIITLVDGEMNPGVHKIQWDGRDGFGNSVTSGVYFYQLKATPVDNSGNLFSQIRKLILLK